MLLQPALASREWLSDNRMLSTGDWSWDAGLQQVRHGLGSLSFAIHECRLSLCLRFDSRYLIWDFVDCFVALSNQGGFSVITGLASDIWLRACSSCYTQGMYSRRPHGRKMPRLRMESTRTRSGDRAWYDIISEHEEPSCVMSIPEGGGRRGLLKRAEPSLLSAQTLSASLSHLISTLIIIPSPLCQLLSAPSLSVSV